jgi:hypothetical protein
MSVHAELPEWNQDSSAAVEDRANTSPARKQSRPGRKGSSSLRVTCARQLPSASHELKDVTMLGSVRAQLRYRYGRAIALVGALLVAVTSFAVLTGTATTQRLEVTGTVNASARAA